MLSLGFSARDLGRVTVASTAGPFAETVLALGALVGRSVPPLGAAWSDARPRRTRAADLQLAAVLHPRPHVVLDLFTLTGLPETMTSAESALLHVDQGRWSTEYRAISPPAVPGSLRGLPDGDRAALRRLSRALAQAHGRLVRPYWSAFGVLAETHRQRLIRSLGERGVEETLARVTRGSWDGSVLSIPDAGRWSDGEVTGRLRGQGVRLVPTVLTSVPVPYFPLEPDRPALLLCPVRPEPAMTVTGGAAPGGLRRLLGRTRVALLAAVADDDVGCSTSEAATAVGVSAGTASEHLTVLREAGLVHSVRRGRRMAHTATPLGRRLLAGSGRGSAGQLSAQ